jgi:hypothetical protein
MGNGTLVILKTLQATLRIRYDRQAGLRPLLRTEFKRKGGR